MIFHMKNTLIATLVLSLLTVAVAPALAQTNEFTLTPNRIEIKAISVDEVGGESEDIGAPTAEESSQSNIGSSGQDGVRDVGIDDDDFGVIDTDDEQAMNKAELIESISTTTTSGADYFIKIGDIKGESDAVDPDENSDGILDGYALNPEAKKPKEIVVVGSKVRGWDPEMKEAILDAAPSSPLEVHNETDLAFLMTRAVIESEDSLVENVTLNFEKITWEYKQQGTFLGFIPLSVPTTLEVSAEPDSYGRIKVHLPWYSRFLGKTLSDGELVQLWEDQLASIGDDAQLANIDLQNQLQKQAQTLQMMSNVSKMLHDTAMAIIRKIG